MAKPTPPIPLVHQQPLPTDDLLPYPSRRRLYACQNGLFLRLKRRLVEVEVFTDPETEAALSAWASDEAIEALYRGERSWPEQRRRIYQWARLEVAAIRLHRKHLDGVKCHASDGVKPLI
ncbi:MAG: hypothetical protein HQK86_04065 [Nitrospinae bacterium]|nr:hypothetical protein [Nitrospinota bacterium]